MKSERIRKIVRALSVVMIVFSLAALVMTVWEIRRGKAHFIQAVEDARPAREDRTLRLGELQTVNPEIVGWLMVDGTAVDYPILQDAAIREEFLRNGRVENLLGVDYQERVYHYLFYDYRNRRSATGSITVDCRMLLDDPYVLIYGHNIGEEEVMFSDLERFRDPAFCEENPGAVLFTETGAYELELIAVSSVNGYMQEVFDCMDAALALDCLKENALFFTSAAEQIRLGASREKLVILSTCAVAGHPEDPERLELVYRIKPPKIDK